MNGHRRLWIWQKARELVGVVYALTRSLPPEEKYVASAQMRRAAWSVCNNIAEGNAKRGRPEMRRFLDVAVGSLGEVDAMAGTLPDVYQIDPKTLESIETLRRSINSGLFSMLRGHGR